MGNPEILTRFQLNQKEIPSFGITDATYWFFFEYEFINKTEGYLLEIEYPLLDEVTFFYTNNQDELIQKVVGDTFPFAQREFEHRNFLFSLRDLKWKGKIFFKIRTSGSMQVPISIHKQKYFFHQKYRLHFYLNHKLKQLQ